MPVIIHEVSADVVSRPVTEGTSAEPGPRDEDRQPTFDELRRRLERSLRLAARLAAD